MRQPLAALCAVWRFYRDGFRQMTWGRTLWIIILLKLLIMFAVLRACFFRPALEGLDTQQRSERVGDNLSRPAGEPRR